MEIIAHLTTVHSRTDTRIRLKETSSLGCSYPGAVVLFVADGLGNSNEELDNVEVVDIGKIDARPLIRMTCGAWKMYRAVSLRRPSVAHFHDPELIPFGLLLKLKGIKVVYDVHENVPQQIMTKHWIPFWLRRSVASLVNITEYFSTKFFDHIITATPTISKRFPEHKTTVVQNFPLLTELITVGCSEFSARPKYVAYVGSITSIRGAREMVQALELTKNRNNVRLQLAGKFFPIHLEDEVHQLNGWDRVDVLGWLNRQDVSTLLGQVRAGLLLFHSAPNHIDAQPNKLFEYMAAGLPIIASDFPLWREIIDGAGCGLLVDPYDTRAIAEAIDWILDNPDQAESMGRRGRDAVSAYYNWSSEAEKLMAVYDQLLIKPSV